ncbi:rCG37717, partial [Rattus norvegicus]
MRELRALGQSVYASQSTVLAKPMFLAQPRK